MSCENLKIEIPAEVDFVGRNPAFDWKLAALADYNGNGPALQDQPLPLENFQFKWKSSNPNGDSAKPPDIDDVARTPGSLFSHLAFN